MCIYNFQIMFSTYTQNEEFNLNVEILLLIFRNKNVDVFKFILNCNIT